MTFSEIAFTATVAGFFASIAGWIYVWAWFKAGGDQ